MPQINVPPVVRFALYVLTVLGTPVIVYLRAKGVFGPLEVSLWDGEVAAVAAMAAFNVTRAPVDTTAAEDAALAADGLDAPASMAAEDPAPADPAAASK